MATHDPYPIGIDSEAMQKHRTRILEESQMLMKKSTNTGRRRLSITEGLAHVIHAKDWDHENMDISPLAKQENAACHHDQVDKSSHTQTCRHGQEKRVLRDLSSSLNVSGYAVRSKKDVKKDATYPIPRPVSTTGGNKLSRPKPAQDNMMAKRLLKHVTENKMSKKVSKIPLQFKVARPEPTFVLDDDLLPVDSMDIDLPQKIRSVQVQVPKEIREIEERLANQFSCPEYAHDIYEYLQTVERRHTFPENFLAAGGDVTPQMRGVLTDWFIQVQVHQEISQQTLHMAVALVDRFMTIQKVGLDLLQLLGITCILISAKFHERFPPEIKTLCFLTDNTFTKDQVIVLEKVILNKIGFDLNMPDTSVFMDRFLEIEVEHNSQEIQYMTQYIVDLCLTEVEFVYYVPSMMAASALYLARKVLGVEKVWTCGLSYYTRYAEKELFDCVMAMAKLLHNAPKATLQGARMKYRSKSNYSSISHHAALKNQDLLTEIELHLNEI